MQCNKVRWTDYLTAYACLKMQARIGQLRGKWQPVRCGICGKIHLERIGNENQRQQTTLRFITLELDGRFGKKIYRDVFIE